MTLLPSSNLLGFLRVVLTGALIQLCVSAAAQIDPSSPGPAASAPASEAVVAVNPGTSLISPSGSICVRQWRTRPIPTGAKVKLLQTVTCRHGNMKAPPDVFVKVEYEGEQGYVWGVDLAADPLLAAQLAGEEQKVADELASLRKRALLRLEKPHGFAILGQKIFDVSEHTEGTGLEFKIVNLSKKSIKYAIFNVGGLNAVGDPVRSRISGSTTVTLRGVGPVERGEIATWRKDYMWMTDLVETFRLASVRIEYMDGTAVDIPGRSVKVASVEEVELLSSER